jgi:hypothetical protein
MAIIKVKISEARVEYLEHLEARGVKASTRRVYEGTIGASHVPCRNRRNDAKGCGHMTLHLAPERQESQRERASRPGNAHSRETQ